MQAASVGYLGCPESEIQISNESQGMGTRTWTASCRGREFLCSEIQGGQYAPSNVTCTARASGTTGQPGSGVAATPGGGCEFDTQCKGDRVCRKGSCEDPSPAR
jgi:hypothetical protein